MSVMKKTLAILALLAASLPAAAQQGYPNKLVRVIAPFPPGGGATDIIIRMVAPKMQEALGQSVVIENRAGANGNIGGDIVAKAAPDGYTLLYASSSNMATNKYLSKTVPFDAQKDFAPISMMATPLTAFVVHASVPVKNIAELVEHAKKNPGKLTYGSAGIGSMQHLTGEAFKRVTGVDMLHVPFKGAAGAINGVMTGQIDVYFPGTSSARPLIQAGKIKLLGLLELERYAGMPDVPTVSETIPGFTKGASWFAMFAPAKTPRPIIDRLNGEIVKALKMPDVRARFDDVGIQPVGSTPERLAQILAADIERSGTLIRALKIEPGE
jgi:tripartite-type tricarboxylate transporter receptor subunit TctC